MNYGPPSFYENTRRPAGYQQPRLLTCTRCGGPRSYERYSWCRACNAANSRATRKEYTNLSLEEKLKARARSVANVAQKRGRIIPQPCEVCGATDNIEKHHDDYSKPLEVRWLCREHHQHAVSIAVMPPPPDPPLEVSASPVFEAISSLQEGHAIYDGRPTLHSIMQAACWACGVAMNECLASYRDQRIVRARHIYFYLARTMTPRSFPEIGRRCGDRDHTTVMHGYRKVKANLSDYADAIHKAKKMLNWNDALR